MSFLDAMVVFYDGKNGILRFTKTKEWQFMHHSTPHFCMFVSHHVPGSVHDYELHIRRFTETYIEYISI
jgi:hypothetical protein